MNSSLLSTDGFPPRWRCGAGWASEPAWGWMTIASDIVLGMVYLSVPVAVALYLLRRKDIEYRTVYLLFAAVFAVCGLNYLLDAVIFYEPVYRLLAVTKVITSGFAVAALVALVRIMPRLLQLQTPEKLSEVVEERIRVETAELRSRTDAANRLATLEAAEKHRLQMAIDGGSLATWFWDTATDEAHVDDGVHRLLGYPDEPITSGSAFFEYVHPDDRDRFAAGVETTQQTGEDLDEEVRIRRADGSEIWIASKARPIESDPTVLVGVNYDVTAEKTHEIELAEARERAELASHAKGEFLANMSHEIRTPLSAVIGCSDLLYPKLQDDEQREILQMVRRQGRLLLELLNDILDLSKIEARKLDINFEPCNLSVIVEDIASLMTPQAGTRGLSLDLTVDDSVPAALQLDPLRIRQVMLNIVGNAIKFTEHGSVAVRVSTISRAMAEKLQQDDGSNRTIGPDGELLLQVDDTGTGIPKERLEEIFQAFSQADGSITRQYGGTGLGLTICQRLVRMMGGTLSVESELGEGSTFTVRLPLTVCEPLPQETTDVSTPVVIDSPLPIRVLVAEDTDTLRMMLQRVLATRVQEVVTVSNGQEALEAVDTSTRDGQPFDLVLMDMQMPVLDGFDATARLRAGGYRGLVYAVSAGATADEHARAVQSGCDAQIDKPIDLQQLDQVLSSAAGLQPDKGTLRTAGSSA